MVTSPRLTAKHNFAIPPYWDERDELGQREWLRQMAELINRILDGATNATGSVTLTNSSTTTTLTDRRIGINSVINFMPTTADAKTEGIPYVTGRGDGTCTLNHSSDSTTRTYEYTVAG